MLAYPMLMRNWGTSAMLALRSRPGIKRVIGVVTHAAITLVLLLPWLAILTWLYLRLRW